VVSIPTNRPMIRADEPDLIYKTEDAKFDALADDIKEHHDAGQPVLIGTISVEKSEKLARLLDKRGIGHEVLNAKQHTREAPIVAQAADGWSRSPRTWPVAVSTSSSVATRGPRGAELLAKASTSRPEARPRPCVEKHKQQCQAEGDKVRALGGLYVLGTERHESRRIDNQLRGRSGRQGDPGESRFYLSLDDELMRIFATGALSWVMAKALPDDVPIEARMVTKAIERAQNTVEQRNAEIRKNVLKYDEVMNEQRKVIYKRRDQILEGSDLRERRAAISDLEHRRPHAGEYPRLDSTSFHRLLSPVRRRSPLTRRCAASRGSSSCSPTTRHATRQRRSRSGAPRCGRSSGA
jgi:preprotein translocase subunit SecA